MSTLSLTYALTAGTPENVNNVQQNFVDITTWANGNIDATNFTSAEASRLGLSQSGSVRRGGVYTPTEESRTNVAYGTLTTPDQVQSVVVAANGIVRVTYKAHVKSSVADAGRAALFIGANQLQAFGASGVLTVQEASFSSNANYSVLTSNPSGLRNNNGVLAAPSSDDITTGLALSPQPDQGGVCLIYGLAAATYTIGVQFKSSSGSISAKNRLLIVESFKT